jgi:hypothetical protein
MKTKEWASAILLAIAIGPAVYAQRYDVNFNTPFREGRKYAVSASATMTVSATLVNGGKVARTGTEEFQVVLTGIVEILQVDAKGEPHRTAYTVETFTRTQDGVKSTLVKPGSVILVEGDRVALKGGILGDVAVSAFKVVQNLYRPESPSNEAAFGSSVPRSIGESWPIDSMAAAEQLRQTGLTVPRDAISGTSTILGKDKLGETDCLDLLIEIQGVGVGSKSLPPDFEIKQADLSARARTCLPIPSRPGAATPFKEAVSMGTDIHLVGINGSPSEGMTANMKVSAKMESVWMDAPGK